MLPKTDYPLFELQVPSTGKSVKYRQMIVKDEKILLVAKASEDNADIYRAVKQVVNNCFFDIDIDQLALFDVEYMFLKLRSSSIGDQIELTFRDLEDEQEYEFIVDLNEVEVTFPEGVNRTIQINDSVSLMLRYPQAYILEDDRASYDSEDSYEFIASKCIETIFDDNEAYPANDCSDEELLDYIMNLDVKSYQDVKRFISNLPSLKYTISYTNSKGTEREFTLSTLTDFFTLR